MILDQLNKLVASLVIGDGPLDHLLSNVEVDLARSSTDIAEISICHLTRPVDNASHDGNCNSREMPSFLPDLLRDLLQVKEGPSARGA